MCVGNPFCSIPPPIGLINMAANHVELQHGVEVTPDARQLLNDRITQATTTIPNDPNSLTTYLGSNNLSHVDLMHLAEKQFVQALPHISAQGSAPVASGQRPKLDAKAVKAGIAQKPWSPLWK